MPTTPAELTWIEGVNPGRLDGVFVLTWIGARQVTPPLVEVDKATPSKWPPLKRESCQTT